MKQTRTGNAAPVGLVCLGLIISGLVRADQLTIDITGIERLGGNMMVAVYDSAKAWDFNGEPVATASDSVTGETVRVIFNDLEPGLHAVKLYHDENTNGELDSNMLGIPSEGYGFSNNGGRLGPPDFDEASFPVDGETSIEIELR